MQRLALPSALPLQPTSASAPVPACFPTSLWKEKVSFIHVCITESFFHLLSLDKLLFLGVVLYVPSPLGLYSVSVQILNFGANALSKLQRST